MDTLKVYETDKFGVISQPDLKLKEIDLNVPSTQNSNSLISSINVICDAGGKA